jgi:Domain of unknown function (DUF4157)
MFMLMRRPETTVGSAPVPAGHAIPAPRVRRPEAGGVVQRQSAGEENRREAPAVPAIVGETLRSGGRPLDHGLRAHFEPRLGRDFEDVRVHTGPQADASARAIGAEAYTVGRDIAFREGAFAPETRAGKRLIAHELTHVVQQNGTEGRGAGGAPSASRIGAPQDASEAEAERVADAVVSGGDSAPVQGRQGAGTVQRQPADPARSRAGAGPTAAAPAHGAGRDVAAPPAGKAPEAKGPKDKEAWGAIQVSGGKVTHVVWSDAPGAEKTDLPDADRILHEIWNDVVYDHPDREPADGTQVLRFVKDGDKWSLPLGFHWPWQPRGGARRPEPQPAGLSDEDQIRAMDPRRIYVQERQLGGKALESQGKMMVVGALLPIPIALAPRAVRNIANMGNTARLALIRDMAEARYVENTVAEVDTLEANVADVDNLPPETPLVRAEDRARGFAHEDRFFNLRRFDYRATPSWFKTIDGYEVDSAAKTYTYAEGEETILVYEKPNVISHKSTRITDPVALSSKIEADINDLRAFKGYRKGNIEVAGAGQRRLVVTIDEQALLERENVLMLESFRKNMRDIDFEWYVSKGTRMIPGHEYMQQLGLPEY